MTRKSKPNKGVRNRIRIIYQPHAGRAKTLTKNIEPDGTISINDGMHTIPEGSTGLWKGKLPWCRINQNQIPALPWFGTSTIPTPQFFNEAVSNHYARDTLEGMEENDRPKKDGAALMVGLLIGLGILFLAMSLWILKDLSSLHDALLFLNTHPAQGPGVFTDTTAFHPTPTPTPTPTGNNLTH